jgi:hypothetical protein
MIVVEQKINLNTIPRLYFLITILVRNNLIFAYLIDIDCYLQQFVN